MKTFQIADIFKPVGPYVLKYVGELAELKRQITNQAQGVENYTLEYFEGQKMTNCDDFLEEMIARLHFDKYIRGGCGRNYDALYECLECLGEVFEVKTVFELVGSVRDKFVLVISDCEYMYSREIREWEKQYWDNNYSVFNSSGEELSGEVDVPLHYERPPIPFHLVYQTQRGDVEFLEKIAPLVLNVPEP